MAGFNTLKYLTIPAMPTEMTLPRWLGIEIGILAGRLYFDWDEYQPLMAWLGLHNESTDGPGEGCGLGIRNPRKFLTEWLTHCRHTHDITHTPMGYICQRRQLKMNHSFFQCSVARDPDTKHIASHQRASDEDEVEDLPSECSDEDDEFVDAEEGFQTEDDISVDGGVQEDDEEEEEE